MYLAAKYCNSIALKALTLDEIHINCGMRWMRPLVNLFYNLRNLELHSCRLSVDFGEFISSCQIPTIKVYSLYGPTEWMNHTFWHLHSMILIEIWHPDLMAAMDEFIKLNGHLHALVIHQSTLSSNIFKTVVQHMPELQLFGFSGRNPRDRKIRKNVLHLARLKNLSKLTLNCSSFSVKNVVDEFSKASVQLSELNICFGTVDMELLEKLSNLKSLKSLQLRRVNMINVSLIDVVTKIPDLDELDIDIKGIGVNQIIKMLPFAEKLTKLTIGCERSHVRIDIVNFQSILRTVKSREKAKNLCIQITSENRHVFVPQHLLQESIYWLKVDNEIYENLRSVMTDSDSDTELQDSSSDDDSVASVEDSDDDSVPPVEDSDYDSVPPVENSNNDIVKEIG